VWKIAQKIVRLAVAAAAAARGSCRGRIAINVEHPLVGWQK
jgi:hypothetical protein